MKIKFTCPIRFSGIPLFHIPWERIPSFLADWTDSGHFLLEGPIALDFFRRRLHLFSGIFSNQLNFNY